MEFIPARLTEYSSALSEPTVNSALVALLLLGMVVIVVAMKWGSATRRSHPNKSRLNTNSRPARAGVSDFHRLVTQRAPRTIDRADPLQQMQAVEACEFERMRLLNRSEARLLPILEAVARDLKQGHRVMAQTSLGEIIKPKGSHDDDRTRLAFNAINAKRLDFALFDREGYLVCAVEYQGTGHHQNGAFLRDAVKREALRKAGVTMLEIRPDFTPDLVAASLRAILLPQPGQIEPRNPSAMRA